LAPPETGVFVATKSEVGLVLLSKAESFCHRNQGPQKDKESFCYWIEWRGGWAESDQQFLEKRVPKLPWNEAKRRRTF
jgi:hypothetical protein